jgi:hypothetical protein
LKKEHHSLLNVKKTGLWVLFRSLLN